MASLLPIAGLLVVVVLHAAIAAVATRFFRVRMATRVGSLLYALVVTPILLLLSTFVFTGVLGIGTDLGGVNLAIFVTIAVPMAAGLAVDYVWMPPPAETLPESVD